MIHDYRSSALPDDINTDICIIGGGPAGITLAKTLENSGFRICLLESGSETLEGPTQMLYALREVGISSGLAAMRLRYLGGTTNHWEGYCGTLDPLDFEPRPWVEHSGWPISFADLNQFYERAHELCELGPYTYSTNDLALEGRTYPALAPDKVAMKLWQRSTPTRFGPRYQDELARSKTISVYLNANATELIPAVDGKTISSLRLASIDESGGLLRRGRLTAKTFILATGGIENIRLLLASNSVVETGLGNQNDLVGRYWMQHPWLETATVVPTDEERYQAELTTHIFSEYHLKELGATVLPGAGLTLERQRLEELLNLTVTIRGARSTTTGFHELKRLGGRIKRGEWPDNFTSRLWQAIQDFESVVDGTGKWIDGEKYFGPFLDPVIYSQVEQAPIPESRVYLDTNRDSLGVPTTVIDWRLTELERRTMSRAMQLFGEEFARLGLGRVKLSPWLSDTENYPTFVAGGGHHMGGTRMALDSSQGVVDPNCKVFGVNNLFIAGSSVFPTGGCMNPTLTIVALALRLAEHLQASA